MNNTRLMFVLVRCLSNKSILQMSSFQYAHGLSGILIPRPETFTIIILSLLSVGASLRAWATAWALSKAE